MLFLHIRPFDGVRTPVVDPIVQRRARSYTLAASLSVESDIHSCWEEVEGRARLAMTVVDLRLLLGRHRSLLV